MTFKIAMKRIILGLLGLSLLLSGCGKSADVVKPQEEFDIPVFSKIVNINPLEDGFNPFMAAVSEDEIFYFAMDEDTENETASYRFYSMTREGEGTLLNIASEDAIVKATAFNKAEGRYCVLWLGEKAYISEYDKSGKKCGEKVLDDSFADVGAFQLFEVLPGDVYAIAVYKNVYITDESGATNCSIETKGAVNKLLVTESGELFAVCEEDRKTGQEFTLSKIDIVQRKISETVKVPGNSGNVFVYGDKFAALSEKYVYEFSGDVSTAIVDMGKQCLLFSQVQFIGKGEEGTDLVLFEKAPDVKVCIFESLVPMSEEAEKNAGESSDYTEDGRKIVDVAVEEFYPYQIEHYAIEYNQKSTDSFIEITRFSDDLESYLGMGARPDMVVRAENFREEKLIEKGLLADMLPLFEKSGRTGIDELVPKTRELLTKDGHIYELTDRFSLLLRYSGEEEHYGDGEYTPENYVEWLKKYIADNELNGIKDLSWLFIGETAKLCNGEYADDYIISDEFMAMAESVKGIYESYPVVSEYNSEIPRLVRDLAEGAYPFSSMRWEECGIEGCTCRGIPTISGNEYFGMLLSEPMFIMEASENKEAAFDFLIYYLKENMGVAIGESSDLFREGRYTQARLSVFSDVMDEEIYNTDKPFISFKKDDGSFGDYYFTDSFKERLKEIIDKSEPIENGCMEVYEIMAQELDSYFNGNKSLDDVCKVIQSRVNIYLSENR